MAKLNSCRVRSFFAGVVLLAACCRPDPGQAAGPLEVVRDSNQAVLDLSISSQEHEESTRARIFAIMDAVTDYDAIAAMAVQEVCGDERIGVCAEIRDEFITMLRLTATMKLGRYRADRFEYLGEDISASRASVRTVAYYKEESLQLDYVLELSNGAWRIVNYLVDDVDTVRNYQRQFKRIVDKETLPGLLARLHKKNREYRNDS